MNNSTDKAIAVIGPKALAQVFRAIGYDCFYDTDPDAIVARCQDLTAQGYKIILICEREAAQIETYLNSREGLAYPIIMPIPDTVTNSHYGLTRLSKNMEKAMGMKLGGNL